jgi:DNA-binding transcriptional LysR family regulator
MDWGDLRYFVALARAGTLSGAARLVGAEHTTVARRIAALEDALGVRLFERQAKGFSLTPEGERIADGAYRVEAEVFGLRRQLDAADPGLQGTVRISAPPVFASSFVAPRLAALRQANPGILIELAGDNRAVSLSRREADIAIRMARPEPSSVVARRVGTLAFGLYGGTDYLARVTEADRDFIGYDESLDHVAQQRWLLALAGGRPLAFRSNDLASLHAAAASGLGLAALPRYLGDADPRLVRVPVAGAPPLRDLWLAVHPDLRRSPRVRAVLDYLSDLIGQSRAILEPAPG